MVSEVFNIWVSIDLLAWPYIQMKHSAMLGLGFFSHSFLITNAKLGYCKKT